MFEARQNIQGPVWEVINMSRGRVSKGMERD